MFQPKVKKKGELNVGDTVLRFSKKSHSWEKVRLSKKYGKIYQNGSYKFEFTDLDGSNPRRNFFYPGAYWSQLNEEEVDLDLATLTTQVDITAAINTSEEEPPVEPLEPEKDRLATLEGELIPEIPLDLYTIEQGSLMEGQRSSADAISVTTTSACTRPITFMTLTYWA